MSKTIDYYMTPVSPFTYLGHDRLRAIAARHGAQIRLKLMDLGKVFPASGGVALKDRAEQRKRYRMMELKRWRDVLGIELTLEPKHFPVPPHLAATVILAVLDKDGTEAALDIAGDCLRAIWAEERDIATEATLKEILAQRGLDAEQVLQHSREASIHQQYEAQTREAIEHGVFGSPTYVLDGELFWGQDRLDLLDRALTR